MKIILCGKGGSGKSTVSALLAKCFTKRGGSVLVIDTDESNFGLHRQLGVELPQDFTKYFGGKEAVLNKIMQAMPNMEALTFFNREWSIDDIPREYYSEKDGVKLIAIGKIEEAGEGCACPMGILAKQLIDTLRLGPNDVVITDTEAGVEHFGRSVEQSVDVILMVVDPSYESIKLSEKVLEMSDSVGKPVYFVLNKVDAVSEQFMRETIGDRCRIITAVPMDSKLSQAGLKGEEIMTESIEAEQICYFLSTALRNCI